MNLNLTVEEADKELRKRWTQRKKYNRGSYLYMIYTRLIKKCIIQCKHSRWNS